MPETLSGVSNRFMSIEVSEADVSVALAMLWTIRLLRVALLLAGMSVAVGRSATFSMSSAGVRPAIVEAP